MSTKRAMIWNVLELVLDENVIYVCFNLCCLVVWLVGCLIHWLAGWLVGWLLGWLLDCLVSGLAGWLHSKDANPRITNPIVSQVWYPFGDPHGTLPHTPPAWQSFFNYAELCTFEYAWKHVFQHAFFSWLYLCEILSVVS